MWLTVCGDVRFLSSFLSTSLFSIPLGGCCLVRNPKEELFLSSPPVSSLPLPRPLPSSPPASSDGKCIILSHNTMFLECQVSRLPFLSPTVAKPTSRQRKLRPGSLRLASNQPKKHGNARKGEDIVVILEHLSREFWARVRSLPVRSRQRNSRRFSPSPSPSPPLLLLLPQLARLDWQDQADVQAALPLVKVACDCYEEHNVMESKFFIPLLEGKEPEHVERWLKEHAEHLELLERMKKVLLLPSSPSPPSSSLTSSLGHV